MGGLERLGRRVGAPVLLAWVLCVIAAGMLTWWNRHGDISVGDEPHYMVVADAVAADGTLDVEQAYLREFRATRFFAVGIASPDSPVTAAGSHVVGGPRGFYSVHGVGLPMLLAGGVALAGVFGARCTMLVLAMGLVVAMWCLAARDLPARGWRCGAVASMAWAFPVYTAASQVYPDLPGGTACLVGVLAVRAASSSVTSSRLVAGASVVALAPWLHLRFALPALVLVVAMVAARRRGGVAWRLSLIPVVPLVVSGVALMAYQQWAFGSVMGPYEDDAVEVSTHSLMTLAGLFVDQNHGLLMQQPLHLVGLFFVTRYVRRHRIEAVAALLVALMVLVPNAAHPVWYGGTSFSGRFGWSASLALVPATFFGLGQLLESARWRFNAALSAAALVQAWYFVAAARGPGRLYNHFGDLGQYSAAFGRLGRLLPALYDTSFAFRHLPNYFAAGVVVAVLAAGVLRERNVPSGVLTSSNG